ncbi:PssD/Cps14F family polysaccharide biosynthesis glycosyltransferase [Chloroflexota bacterium]
MKVGIVCSDGGHLTEMLQIKEAFEGHDTFFITYNVVGGGYGLENVYLMNILKKNPLRYLASLPFLLKVLLKEKPKIIVSNGAEIAIPTLYLAKLLGIKIIFIETIARVDESSFTGRLIYPLANIFLVQWPQMLEKYGKKARYHGRVF